MVGVMVAVDVFSAVGEGVFVCVSVAVDVGDGSGVALVEGEGDISAMAVVLETVKKLGGSHAVSRKSKVVRMKQVKGKVGFMFIFFVMVTG